MIGIFQNYKNKKKIFILYKEIIAFFFLYFQYYCCFCPSLVGNSETLGLCPKTFFILSLFSILFPNCNASSAFSGYK